MNMNDLISFFCFNIWMMFTVRKWINNNKILHINQRVTKWRIASEKQKRSTIISFNCRGFLNALYTRSQWDPPVLSYFSFFFSFWNIVFKPFSPWSLFSAATYSRSRRKVRSTYASDKRLTMREWEVRSNVYPSLAASSAKCREPTVLYTHKLTSLNHLRQRKEWGISS